MTFDFDQIVDHTSDDDCPVCRAQDIISAFLVPAVSAWEMAHNLPRYSLAIHGAAGLIGVMLEEGIGREEIESALAGVLDDIERQIAEDRMLGGPTQGSA